jgi:hypothetical protein
MPLTYFLASFAVCDTQQLPLSRLWSALINAAVGRSPVDVTSLIDAKIVCPLSRSQHQLSRSLPR